ncbi:alpha-2-macroglobulin [Winogradskyella undariae]|uniref:alpha-2-macroglobulin family protein n=1 Tax=Winogradskyella undariae TaxID=1285465 RepID=UPI00156B0306|nr:MG2 domain-containing protein [Winogradskyella undariae]NRR93034.1 alpha-2-macroglobulin [Winogradskyella undariae]
MKNYIILLMIICFAFFSNAQNKEENQWKEVDQLEKKGLTKSASDLVETIYNNALEENNKKQRIKALLYTSKYMLVLEEDAQFNIVNRFKNEINSINDTTTKQLLENMLATMYWQYYRDNRYKFYNRSKTTNKTSDDFRTWDLETLFNEIHIHYQRSLQNDLLLQKAPLTDYSTLLNEVKNSKEYRPTLYDLLSHNALSFYKTDENGITQPANKFTIDNDAFIANSKIFTTIDLSSKDTLSLQRNALKIYQNLLKFHSKDSTSKAYITVDIERLNFVFQHATFKNKEELLLKSLKEKAELLKDSPLSALYNYEIASLYYQQGNRYDSDTNAGVIDETHRWKLKEAVELYNLISSKYPDSRGTKNSLSIIEKIKEPSLNILREQYIPINTPSKVLVTYKNINSIDFKIYKVNQKQLEKYNELYQYKEKAKFLNSLKTFRNFASNLKTEHDFQMHTTEIVMPNLSNGLYIIKADVQDNIFATSDIQVTDIALIESSESGCQHYQIINRQNGEPFTNAKAEITYSNSQRDKRFNKTFTTDHFGRFQFEFEKDQNYYRDVEIKISTKDDTAYFGNHSIYKNHEDIKNNDTKYNAFLFTDRSIYRPGQTVYFKGIITKFKNEESSVVKRQKIKAELYNTNGEKVSEQSFTSNEFGSIHGEFILPNNGLTGQFYIKLVSDIINKQHYFSVEEYKRPKFKPEFQPITETYKVNDSITVNGTAIAFSGSAITDAKVVYRVKRQVQYPSWFYWRRPYNNSQAQEITFGEIKTNNKGEFNITFKALPDDGALKENLPVFNYEVTADITDINGETRTVTTTVNVGYHSMTVNVVAPKFIDKKEKNSELSLISENLNGEFAPAKGTLKIYKLKAPRNVLRTRPWSAPDYQVLSKDEFKKLFPHESYDNEVSVTSWKKGKEVFSSNFNTEKDKSISLKNLKKWDSGQYIIVLESKDKFGQALKDEANISIFSTDDKTIADNQLFEGQLNKPSYNIGDTALLTIGSAAKNIVVTVEIEKDNKIVKTQLIKLNNSKETISIPVLENDLGGFVVHTSFAAFNEFKSQSFNVNVPYPKTDLEIETITFRDKLQPGQDETWSFKIKGPQGDKVSAELLASMYDASLDEFKSHNWSFNPLKKPLYYGKINKTFRKSFGNTNFRVYNNFKTNTSYSHQSYDELNWFGFSFENNRYLKRKSRLSVAPIMEDSSGLQEIGSFDDILSGKTNGLEVVSGSGQPGAATQVRIRGNSSLLGNNKPLYLLNGEAITADAFSALNPNDITEITVLDKSQDLTLYGERGKNGVILITTNSGLTELQQVNIRKNLNETAFFFPQLHTDKEGNVSFNFKAPEALTKWKLQLLAHTKTLESAVTQLEAVTQKELMVIPNTPRFLREGDEITISTKISNLTESQLSGITQLVLTDAVSGEDVSKQLILSSTSNNQNFVVDAKGNTQVSWQLKIPEGLQAVQYKIIAKAGDFSDGEQNALPVLSNRMLVTETLPMWVRSNQTKTFTLDKLKNNTSTSLTNHKLTLEMTSNPAWYAVQALPYLMEYPYDCNEQTFSRYYANALAQHIVKSNPRIEAVFNQWKSTDALLSNLEKNQELKSLLIQETPWLRDAQSNTEQKKRIALLFDLNKMNNELQSAVRKLKTNQQESGAWPWFNGGRDNRFITQHIIAGFGHLKQLSVTSGAVEMSMIENAINYLDTEFVQEYKNIKKYNKSADLSKDHLSHTQLHYLYTRSFYPEIKTSSEVEKIMDYYQGQIKKYWLSRSLYEKGLMALTMNRKNDTRTAGEILKSLKENSITSEELGMYWKDNTNSWHWYQAPIETQALMVEVFSEAGNVIMSETKNLEAIDNLKIWLLKNKQTNRWKTTKATTEAVYALLLQGSDWLSITEQVDVKVGNETITPSTLENVKSEAGTGYYKTSWNGSEIKPEQADVTITKKGKGIAWGALYWQYFEDLDKITSAETPLKLSKKLFLKSNTDKGEEITEITSESKLKVGDLVRVRIELRTDRNMEFLHLKDMRAAGLEPVNVLSQYKWQDGLGYYESTKDAATNFFMDYLPKGIYIFEYDLRVNNAGDMSNGISTIESMYAPEFSSHSKGVRVLVE